MLPLSGYKIVELASVLAGPAVGTFFAELGAEVLKIENSKGGGDVTRSWKSSQEPDRGNVSAYFSSINYGKEYLSLDLSQEVDRQTAYEHIRSADIVIANFRESSANKLGMDFKSLTQVNPHIIYGQITGFLESDRPAYDAVLQAESGFMSMNGPARGNPVKMPVALIDVLAAHQLKEGLLVALLKQKESKKPYLVSVSLEESAIASLVNQGTNYLMNNQVPSRMGSLHPNIAPYGEILTTKDKRKVVLAIGTHKQFQAFCTILQCPELADDPRFSTNEQRVINRKTMLLLLQGKASKIHFDELYSQSLNEKIPVGEIKTVEQVLTGPVGSKMILEEELDGHLTQRVKTTVFRIETLD